MTKLEIMCYILDKWKCQIAFREPRNQNKTKNKNIYQLNLGHLKLRITHNKTLVKIVWKIKSQFYVKNKTKRIFFKKKIQILDLFTVTGFSQYCRLDT